jgi:gamma-D-glutamyl-L-lysine dipeptidyl-peptidase
VRHVPLLDLQLPRLSVLYELRAEAPEMTWRVRSSLAPLLAEPRISSEQISQLLCGQPLTVLATEGDWLRVCRADGYEGWTHRGYVSQGAEGAWLTSLGCTIVSDSGSLLPVPLGALVSADAHIVEGGALSVGELRAAFPATRASVTRAARTAFAGAPYSWGGVTPWGADCSGFVQTIFALHGIALPRDAAQQAQAAGPLPGQPGGITGIMAADLLFFSSREDRRPTHVGIALGGSPPAMAHVALGRGGHAIDRWDDDQPYVRTLVSQFVAARRIPLD